MLASVGTVRQTAVVTPNGYYHTSCRLYFTHTPLVHYGTWCECNTTIQFRRSNHHPPSRLFVFFVSQHIQRKFAFIVLVVDLLDASATLVTRIRSIVGRNPVLLVGNKADLLPEGTDPEAVAAWLLQFADARKLGVVGAAVVSSTSGQGNFSIFRVPSPA